MGKSSIKGAVVAVIAEHVARLSKQGKLGPDQLHATLDEKGLAAVAGDVQTAVWYPVEVFDRLMDVCLEVDAPADEEAYLRLNGQILAARLRDLGVYSQLESGRVDTLVGMLGLTGGWRRRLH